MKYEVIADVPAFSIKGSVLETKEDGFVEFYFNDYPVYIDPLYYPHLFRLIKPKRVLVIEYEIIPDTIQVDWSQGKIRESTAQEYVSIGVARIEERY